jgi:hypothetical protein
MAQKLFADKIGALTHSAGNILMAASSSNPAYLTIGGQQYTVTSQLSVALPAMSANTRYQVFAVQSAGVVSLAISANENSVGPSGYSSWKLVGSLYASPTGTFGGFVNIFDTPTTDWIDGGLASDYISAVTTPPTKATTTLRNKMFWMRKGKDIFIRLEYKHNNATGSNAGSGNYQLLLLSPYLIDTNFMDVSGNTTDFESRASAGTGMVVASASFAIVNIQPFSASRFVMYGFDATSYIEVGSVSTQYPMDNPGAGYNLNYSAPISTWSNTPIEDL